MKKFVLPGIIFLSTVASSLLFFATSGAVAQGDSQPQKQGAATKQKDVPVVKPLRKLCTKVVSGTMHVKVRIDIYCDKLNDRGLIGSDADEVYLDFINSKGITKRIPGTHWKMVTDPNNAKHKVSQFLEAIPLKPRESKNVSVDIRDDDKNEGIPSNNEIGLVSLTVTNVKGQLLVEWSGFWGEDPKFNIPNEECSCEIRFQGNNKSNYKTDNHTTY